MYHMLLDGAGTGAVSSVVDVQEFNVRQYIIAQVTISATLTCQVQGRISDDFTWVNVYEFTATEAKQVTAMPQMRFEVTAYTSGTVDAGLAG